MTGMIVLDVVIGLIFIYLFYSLFCTVIVEIIATNFGLRARNLKISIIRILSDNGLSNKETRKSFWNSNYFPGSNDLAKAFYDSPIIKYLGFSDRFKKPAWIGNETFVDAIFCILDNQKATTKSLVEKIKDFIENPPITVANTETFKQIKFYFDKSNGDLDRFRENLSLWYDEIGERSTGWYKKRIQKITFFVGLVMATAFNVDTIQIATKLSQDEDARRFFIEASENIINNTETDSALRKHAVDMDKKALDSMFKQSFEIQSILSLNRCKVDNSLQSHCEKCAEYLKEKTKEKSDSGKTNDSREDSLSIILKNTSLDSCNCKSELATSKVDIKTCHWFRKYIFSGPLNIIGCLITAIALSLGSPFWFDLLNKFMQLRGSVAGGATDEKKLNNKTENGETIKG